MVGLDVKVVAVGGLGDVDDLGLARCEDGNIGCVGVVSIDAGGWMQGLG